MMLVVRGVFGEFSSLDLRENCHFFSLFFFFLISYLLAQITIILSAQTLFFFLSLSLENFFLYLWFFSPLIPLFIEANDLLETPLGGLIRTFGLLGQIPTLNVSCYV